MPSDSDSASTPPQPHDERAEVAPSEAPQRERRVARGVGIGIFAAVLIVPVSAYIGAFFDERANRGADLAGLAGFVGGGMVGLTVVLVGSISAIVSGRRGRRPMLRGFGQGMAIALLLALLAFGICALVT